MKTRILLGLVCSGAILTACTTTPPEPPAMAVTEVAATNCDQEISIANTLTLTPEKKSAYSAFPAKINKSSKCFVSNGRIVYYVVFALPNAPDNHTLTMGGVFEPLRTFAPKISLLGADGKETRAFAPDKYANYGGLYGVQFRPSANDKFVLVQSNPELVGITQTGLDTRVASSYGYAYNPATYGGSSYQIDKGVEVMSSRMFSHEGTISVTIQAIKGKIGLPDEK